jgi:AcrR family transcriptional regulator
VKTKSNYHHGDLRSVLMALAVEDISASGVEKLSLRALARRAGVSATAPFRHFADKQALLAALATQGFEDLAQRMQIGIENESDLARRFVQMGVTYVGFARDFPVHYQLMFGAVLGDFSQSQDLQRAADNAYRQLDQLLCQLVQEKNLSHDVKTLGGTVWSTVHGMASLLLNVPVAEQAMDSQPRQAVAMLSQDVEASLLILLRGITAST